MNVSKQISMEMLQLTEQKVRRRSAPQGHTFIGNVNIGILSDNKIWNLTFRLEYYSGFLINTSAPEKLSK